MKNFNAFYGCLEREVWRYLKEPIQTIFDSVFSNILFLISLYFLRPSQIGFIIPGMVIFTTFNVASVNTRMTLFIGKIEGTLYYQLAAPISRIELYIIYILASLLKSIIINSLIMVIAFILFYHSGIYNIIAFPLVFLLINITFINIGILMSLYSESWNTIGAIESYIIGPLLYLSGSFFSLEQVPKILHPFFYINPFFHFTNLLRYIFSGYYELNLIISIFVCLSMFLLSTIVCLYFFQTGYKLLK